MHKCESRQSVFSEIFLQFSANFFREPKMVQTTYATSEPKYGMRLKRGRCLKQYPLNLDRKFPRFAPFSPLRKATLYLATLFKPHAFTFAFRGARQRKALSAAFFGASPDENVLVENRRNTHSNRILGQFYKNPGVATRNRVGNFFPRVRAQV